MTYHRVKVFQGLEKGNTGFSKPWKSEGLCYPAAMNGDDMIRKQVGRPRGESPLVRLERLNHGLRNLGLMQPHESRTDHVRKTVGRAGHRTG